MSLAATYQHKLFPKEWIDRSLDQCRKEYSNEPWVGQDLGYGWTMVPIMAQVLELAGSTDRNAIWQAAHKLDIHDVMATRACPGQGMAFDESGRIAKKYHEVFVVQWQGGVARVIFPTNLATAKPASLGK